ncbi:hypothetical protein LX59_03034 [Azomonas agilis]|uniref:HTH cro/C1-type domain-containing protein n=1 Tax=Azomonas agilis TaxID=116849 RepID=A0A562HYM7_9GAMM|nr:hypothetical protein LX59_03034 [Azomonas agilis]
MSKKKPLSDDLRAECVAANALFLSKKNELKLSQKKIADALGITPAGVSLYLSAVNPLNAKFAAAFARLIKEPVEAFSPRLAQEIAAIAKGMPTEARAQNVRERSIVAASLASPKSREILEKITQAAEDGLLTDEDIELLEMMVHRIMQTKANAITDLIDDGSNTRLRNRLNAAPDTDPQQ